MKLLIDMNLSPDAYRESQQKKKIAEIARSMVDEYRQNSDHVALTSLDGEGFK